MPIELTPLHSTLFDPVNEVESPAEAQNVVTPKQGVDHFDGQVIATKRQAGVIVEGQEAVVEWVMRDSNGNPVDLSVCDFVEDTLELGVDGSSSEAVEDDALYLKLRVAEQVNGGRIEASGYSTVPSEGKVRAALPQLSPGIYMAEFAIVNADGVPRFANQFYLIVNNGLFGDSCEPSGPPSVPEIRLMLRDFGGDNELLGNVDFDAAEIALAAHLPIQQWNEMLPPLNVRYSTKTFPYRYHWLQAICATLFSIAAEHYRRNDLQYSAGGTQIADKRKANEYEAKAAQLKQEWTAWAREKKIQLNIESGWGYVGSPYG